MFLKTGNIVNLFTKKYNIDSCGKIDWTYDGAYFYCPKVLKRKSQSTPRLEIEFASNGKSVKSQS